MDKESSCNYKQLPHLKKEQRLPRCLKDAEKVLKTVKSCKSNFKTVLANSRFRGGHFKKVYALTFNVLKHYDYIQKIIDNLQLLEKEPLLRREITSLLIYEIIFGTGKLLGESKAILTILQYKDDIMNVHEMLQSGDDQGLNLIGFYLPRYARVHTLVTTVAYVIKDLKDFGFEQVLYDEDISEDEYALLVKSLQKGTFLVDFHFKDVLVFAYNENLINLKLYNKGHIFLQDKSSYIPIHALNPEPGSAVLDACAAPGMKAVHIAAKMQNKGVLIACEMHRDRFETLKEMLQHGSVKISKLFCKDFKLIDPNDQAFSSIDYILLDPSCSGSGMVNRMDEVTDTEDSKTKERLMKLAGFQIILLKHALKFPSVKRVVYSTCSIHEEENEYVVHEALNAFNFTFKLVPVMPEWSGRGLKTYEHGELCLRTEPKKHLTNGFFVAMFERLDSAEQYERNAAGNYEKGRTDVRGQSNQDSRTGNYSESTKWRKMEISQDSETGKTVEVKQEMLESQFDSSSARKKRKKNSCVPELDNETKEDVSFESRFDSASTKKKKETDSCTLEIITEAKDKNFQGNLGRHDSPSTKKKKHSSTLDLNTEVKEEKETVERSFDSSSTKKRKKKHSSTLDLNTEIIEVNETVERSFDSSSTKKRKKKHSSTSDLNTEVIVENETVERSFDSSSTKKGKRKNSSALESSPLETPEVLELDGDIIYLEDVKTSNSPRNTEFKNTEKDDNCAVKHKNHSVNRSIDNVENSDVKHKKKKHKKHSRDTLVSDCQTLINNESIQRDSHDNEGNTSYNDKDKYAGNEEHFLSLQTLDKKLDKILTTLDDSSKKKHKKHKSSTHDKTFHNEEIDLTAECSRSGAHDLMIPEFVDSSPVKQKKKKHKKHSRDSDKNQNDDKSLNESDANHLMIPELVDSSPVKHKKKKHKHSRDSDKCRDTSQIDDKSLSEKCDKSLGKEDIEVKEKQGVDDSLSQCTASFVTNISVSPKRKKSKKHSHVVLD